MVTLVIGLGLCAVAFSYCLHHDNPKHLTVRQGKCCNDSFCEEDCGGWRA